jgi:general secretion pathway protein D
MISIRPHRDAGPLARAALLACGIAAASGCASPSLPGSPAHVTAPVQAGTIPAPVELAPPLPEPKASAKAETYSVTVTRVPVQQFLFALARDAGLNIDIHPSIEGTVTLNALDQTLPQLLKRVARQVDMRYEIENGVLSILPDTPVWRNYRIDYVNMARSTNSAINIATQISTTGASGAGTGSQPASATTGNNNSTTVVVNRAENNFWLTLERNLRDLLRDSTLGDPLTAIGSAPPASQSPAQAQAAAASQLAAVPANPAAPPSASPQGVGVQVPPENVLAAFGAASAPASQQQGSVVLNAEAGLIAVRATGRQHEKVQEFLDIVSGSAKRQVMIEATIIEVRLSDKYQQGINWSRIHNGLTLTQGQVGTLPSGVVVGSTPGVFTLNYINPTSRLGNITTAIQLLESFGKVRVLSSPKLSVLNNQTAMLKVVDNNVFFTIKVTPAVIGANGNVTTPATYESELKTVPVGFVMSVTPQIADNDEVTLNVRPTITRIVGFETDPNPALADARVTSRVPVIQARELESVLKVYSGEISMLGGLMQESVDQAKDGLPLVSKIPVIGDFFSYRNESASKTELVIFLRPVVVRSASIDGDYRDYRYLLPARGN